MDLDTLGRLVTLCLFGAAGWFISRRLRVPVASRAWVLLALAALIGSLVKFWLVSVFGFTVHANWAIVSCCLGILVGLLVRSLRLRSAKPGVA